MKISERVKRYFTDKDAAIWFTLLCEHGTKAIEAQAWQVAKEIPADENETRDAMLELAHELLPDSPAGAEDPKQVLFRELGIWASRQPQAVQNRLSASLEGGFQEAWESGLYALRMYLRECCQAALQEEAA